MNRKLIFSFFFSLLWVFSSAQQVQDTLVAKWKYEPNFMVGIDVLNGSLAAFGDRKQGKAGAKQTE